jgi:hypothetical protein
MVEEIEPSIRFCDYQIKRGGGAAPDASDLLALGGEGEGGAARGLLQSKLAALQVGRGGTLTGRRSRSVGDGFC